MPVFVAGVVALLIVLGVTYLTQRRWVVLLVAAVLAVGGVVWFAVATNGPDGFEPFECSPSAIVKDGC